MCCSLELGLQSRALTMTPHLSETPQINQLWLQAGKCLLGELESYMPQLTTNMSKFKNASGSLFSIDTHKHEIL